MLDLETAKRITDAQIQSPQLRAHCLAVSAAMGAMASYFGSDSEYWQAIGYLHDVDYEKWSEEHLKHTREILEPEGIDEEDIRAVLSHGWGLCTDVEPLSVVERSLYTVDELTGIVTAAALMRPTGIEGMEVSSLKKKFKDKGFAKKCDRSVIQHGCELLGLPLETVMALTIDGMRQQAEALGLAPKEDSHG